MSARHAGKTAIVTGASRGIGLAIARQLLLEGANVAITGRKRESLDEAAAGLGAGERLLTIPGNAADPDHCAEAVAATIARFEGLELLVNNTGINPSYARLMDADRDVFRKILDTNVIAAVGWIQECVRAGMDQRGGAVVNIASVAGLRPSPMIGAYGVSKAALIQVTGQLGLELAPKVRVNAVAPAVVKTSFASALYEGREENVLKQYPLGRLGQPEDVAAAAAYLLSDEAGWITGATLTIDGGLLVGGGLE